MNSISGKEKIVRCLTGDELGGLMVAVIECKSAL
jgi:hypothetical protein